MRNGDRCGECGAIISDNSPGGYCAQCLLGLGLTSHLGRQPSKASISDWLDPIHTSSAITDSTGSAAAESSAEMPASSPIGKRLGLRVGRYRILHEIGHGGCGIVYQAEQEEPVRREVALKVVKLGMDTKQVVARFRAEAQTLALMEHPNIAKVLDAGTTNEGRPYFVMELVRGSRITEYCDQNRLSVSERLRLFVHICQGIQHAHQKGVIHRDIKPSNILVTVHDGVPVPKVIDFGIAKATQGRLTDQTLFTAAELFLGTPAYMSPEQADLSALDIDTRSDIYSLGVLLYELLVGTTPFLAKNLLALGVDRMRWAIREEEPLRPSTRLSAMSADERRCAATRRQTEPDRLIHQIRGDLDWIVMKCLEKERTRRYETANGLAMDVQRHLAEEPVMARPPSALYQIQKFVLRNRHILALTVVLSGALILSVLELLGNGQFLSVATIGLALVSGILWSGREAIRARRAERDQERSRREAEAARESEASQRAQVEAHELSARRRAYASEMVAAWQSFTDGHIPRTRELLKRQLPTREHADDFRGFEWRYLWAQAQPSELAMLDDRSANVAVYSHDGRWIAVGRNDGMVSLWDAKSFTKARFFRAFKEDVTTLAFSSDSKVLATGSRFEHQDRIKLWRLDEETAPVILADHRQETVCVDFSRDGRWFVTVAISPYTSGIAPEIRIWDAGSHQPKFDIHGHRHWVRSAAFSPDSRMLLTGDGQGLVKLWDLEEQCEIAALTGHQGFVGAVAFSPQGDLFASADERGTVLLWNWPSATVFAVISAHHAPIYSMAISKDGRKLVTASRDHTAKLFDIRSGTELATFHGHSERVHFVRFSPDDSNLITAGGKVLVWQAAPRAGSVVFSPEKSTGTVAFSPDGRHLIQELWKFERAVLWESKQMVQAHPPFEGRNVVFSPDSRLIALVCRGELRVFESETGMLRGNIPTAAPVSGPISFSPDGKLLAVRRENTLVVIEVASQREVCAIEATSEEPAPVAFSRDSTILLTAGPVTGTIRLWDTTRWAPIEVLCGHSAAIEALALSPDGRWLASGGHDHTFRFWSLTPLLSEAQAVVQSNAGAVTCLAFSPDGRTLGVGTFDGAIRLWNVIAREEAGSLYGHASVIRGLAFSPDGLALASSSYDGTWRLWTAPSFEEISSQTGSPNG